MTPDPAPSAPHSRTARRVLAWQAGFLVTFVGLSMGTGRGDPKSIAAGGLVLSASFLLQGWAVTAALGRTRRPGVAAAGFSLKLLLVLGLVSIGLGSRRIAPMSFAAGATSLLLAILADTCYGSRRFRHRDP